MLLMGLVSSSVGSDDPHASRAAQLHLAPCHLQPLPSPPEPPDHHDPCGERTSHADPAPPCQLLHLSEAHKIDVTALSCSDPPCGLLILSGSFGLSSYQPLSRFHRPYYQDKTASLLSKSVPSRTNSLSRILRVALSVCLSLWDSSTLSMSFSCVYQTLLSSSCTNILDTADLIAKSTLFLPCLPLRTFLDPCNLFRATFS